MQKRKLGSSGLEVSAIGLGAMPLSIARRPDKKTAIGVVHAALDAGINFIDTADVYCLNNDDIGHNEDVVKQALSSWGQDASDIIVATKGGLERPGGDWTRNGHPAHIKAACDRSLAALGVEQITLYQLHAPDPEVPLEDTIGALKQLQDAGKIAHIGLSNVTVDEIKRARALVEIVSVQNRCNLLDRASFKDGIVRYCSDNNIAFLPHSPVGGHWGHTRLTESATLAEISIRHEASPYEIALAWLLHLGKCIIPIPGASRAASAISSARAADISLTSEQMDRLNNTPL